MKTLLDGLLILVGLLILALITGPAAWAQAPDDAFSEIGAEAPQTSGDHVSPVSEMLVGGLGGGGLLFSVGFSVSALSSNTHLFNDNVETPFYVGSACGAVGLGLGVHLGNDSRGSLALTLLTSLVLGAAGSYGIVEAEDVRGALLLVVPAVQIFATMAVERATTTAETREEDTERVSLAPRAQVGFLPVAGGGGLVVSGRF